MIIYRITNNITTKSYVGQTIFSLEKRWKKHIIASKNFNYKFYKSIRKYGAINFSLEILETVESLEKLDEREMFWINYYDTYKNGYNSTTGGKQENNISEETKRKISERKKNTKVWLGRKHTKESKLKMSKAQIGNKKHLGIRHTEETKLKIKETLMYNKIYSLAIEYMNSNRV